MRLFVALVLCVSLVAPAQADTQTPATGNDYPSAALREGREGTASYTIVVNESGRAESCKITKSSGWADLDEATCAVVMRRARFTPATDAQGKPTKGEYSNRVAWRIPRN
jgi:protein TonB